MHLVIRTSAIGRVAALGLDAVSLRVSQFILIDFLVRSRDDSTAAVLLGVHEGHNEGSKELMHGCDVC